ncbi:MAG: hypothetical protein LBH06_08065 [Rikenellaceae bacterium]|jgi:tetratricopeptide (TPR) repeat protein|nr:hypothetical protein [Rikenellaceae bacterium]
MKRSLVLSALFAMGWGGVMCQTASYKLDEEGLNKKIAKSDAAIADVKKNAKPATWIDRGNLFVDVYNAPIKGLYVNQMELEAELLFGKSARQTRTIGKTTYELRQYPYFEAYMEKTDSKEANRRVLFWEQTKFVDREALEKSVAAFDKAYELDMAKSGAKVKAGLMQVAELYKQEGYNYFSLNKYAEASASFGKAFDVQRNPAVGVVDTTSAYNAGQLATYANEYERGARYLKAVYDLGDYNNGDTYYFLYFCYFNLNKYAEAKTLLLEGLSKYPSKNEIVEGLLNVYIKTGEDPSEIIPLVQKAIDADPKNPVLWDGLGRVYDKLNDPGKASEAFVKVVELLPDNYDANFNLGLLRTKEGDVLNKDFAATDFGTSQKEYEAALSNVQDHYQSAIAPLERAHELNPKEVTPVEMIVNILARLRKRPGMQEKYDKYKLILDELAPAQ